LPVRVRAHPLAPPDANLVRDVERLGGSWDRSASLAEALKCCKAVACVNSSSGIEALAHRLPVLCYGLANYRQPGAVYCLTNRGEETVQATEELAAGSCSLYEERCAATLKRILDHQWPFDEIPKRLPTMLTRLLAGTSTLRCRDGGIVKTLLRFVRDFPEQLLVRRKAA
jgi:capsular polysaccharide biosynthesis protein